VRKHKPHVYDRQFEKQTNTKLNIFVTIAVFLQNIQQLSQKCLVLCLLHYIYKIQEHHKLC